MAWALVFSLETEIGWRAVGAIRKCHVTPLIKTKHALIPQYSLQSLWSWPWGGPHSPCARCELDGSAGSGRGAVRDSPIHPSQDCTPSQGHPDREHLETSKENQLPRHFSDLDMVLSSLSVSDVAPEAVHVLAVLYILVSSMISYPGWRWVRTSFIFTTLRMEWDSGPSYWLLVSGLKWPAPFQQITLAVLVGSQC